MKNTIIFLIAFLLLLPSTEASTTNLTLPAKKITIYWDSSLSMMDKDIETELSFLASYFNQTQNVTVDLITFSNNIDLQQRFDVVNANWNGLKEALLKTNYDGVAFYDVLLEASGSDINFLFTDGIEIIDKLILNKTIPTYVVNSSKKANLEVLEQQSILSNGNFINLNDVSIQKALTLLSTKVPKKVKSELKDISTIAITNDNFITGSVYSSDGALLGATISINGETGVVTDSEGKFRIEAAEGDILIASYLGMKTQEILIDEDRRFEVLLLNDETELEEVVVKGKSEPITEMVETGYGKSNKEKIGYAVQSIDYEDLPEGRDDNLSVHGKFSGVTSYNQNDDISQMILRATSFFLNVYPLIIVDGVPISRSSSVGRVELTNFIDPNNVAKITILKSLAATNRYGSEGGNGVILITTKTSLAAKKSKDKKNTALVKNNDFTENLTLLNTSADEKYIEEVKQFLTLNEVYKHYLKQRINYKKDPMYFVNFSDYVLQFGSKELASKILSNCLENNLNNTAILKLVAYKADQQQDYFFAKRIYEKIAALKPRDAQSYRDLALIFQKTGYYQKALTIYKKIQNNSYSGVNFSGIQKVITNEMSRLILQHSNELDLSNVSDNYLKPLNYDARIVFEYNDSTAEFELQFVNPQKKFFSWSHNKIDNEIRLHKEKKQGYNTEEFLLIDAEKGEWQINIEHKNPQSKKPVILKYTVYKNYGEASETKETKTIILNNIKEKQLLGKIVI
jgi:TonB-dependent SusC/RagA subfamily outer membrane receptor